MLSFGSAVLPLHATAECAAKVYCQESVVTLVVIGLLQPLVLQRAISTNKIDTLGDSRQIFMLVPANASSASHLRVEHSASVLRCKVMVDPFP